MTLTEKETGFAVIYRMGAMKLVKEFWGENKWKAFDFAHWSNGKVVVVEENEKDRHNSHL